MAITQQKQAKNNLSGGDNQEPCPMTAFINLLSGKWAIPIIYRLIITQEPIRFNTLQKAISPITQKELTRQLRKFEINGLVNRVIYPEIPPRVEYQATELAQTLKEPLDSLAQWMTKYRYQFE